MDFMKTLRDEMNALRLMQQICWRARERNHRMPLAHAHLNERIDGSRCRAPQVPFAVAAMNFANGAVPNKPDGQGRQYPE
jgi:hypothetical protein